MGTVGGASSSTFKAGDGDGYERQMGRWSRRLAPLLIDFAGTDSARHILDVGCGTGSLTSALSENPEVEKISAIDFSAAYIEHAKHLNKDARIHFQVGDACALPFEDGIFDYTASLLVLSFVPKPDVAMREMRRVTRPGGTVAVCTWDVRGGLVMARMFWDTAAMLDQSAMERRASTYSRPMTRPGDLARAFQAAGLCDVVDGTLNIRMDFACFEDFWAPMQGQDGPYAEHVERLSTEARRNLREALRLAYVDGETDGARSYAATAWVAKGRTPEQ